MQKDGYLFSVLLIFSNFSLPFIREKEYELFKNKKWDKYGYILVLFKIKLDREKISYLGN